ncbi:E3 ubiquitin-conjugating enzyme FATS, partial [Camelus dromedarius]
MRETRFYRGSEYTGFTVGSQNTLGDTQFYSKVIYSTVSFRILQSSNIISFCLGLPDNQYRTHGQIALKNLQSDVTEKKSDFTEGTLASQNTKMISSIVISQLIDGKKSRENGAVLPVPPACPMKPPLANRSAGTIHRAFAFLPGRLGIQTRLGERGPVTGLPPKGEKPPCSGSPKGFASITITARRVVPPASTLVWQAVEDPLCIRCRAQDTLLGDPPALASGADPSQHHGPFTCAGFSRNSAVMRLKVPEAHAGLCAGHEYWITNVDNRGGSFPPGTLRSGKSPPVFSSCVHLRVSQQCPNSIYYLDRSLSVPIEPPRLAGPKMHRSVLSLSLSCSSHTLTPDGAAGTANAEPMSRALKPELTEGSQTLPGPSWNLGLQGFLKENPSLGRVHSGTMRTGPCPWRGFLPPEFADAETNQVTGRKGQEDQAARCHISGHANQLSIHIPGWSYTAGECFSQPPCRRAQTPPLQVTGLSASS